MKWLLLLGFIVCVHNAEGQQNIHNNFSISGYIKGLDSGWLYLNYIPIPNEKGILDSCKIKNGHFQFKGKIQEPMLSNLTTFNFQEKVDPLNIAQFYLEASKMQIQVEYNHFKKILVSGSFTDKDYRDYIRLKSDNFKLLNLITDSIISYREKIRSAEKSKISENIFDSMHKKINQLEAKRNLEFNNGINIDKTFITFHKNSILSAILLYNFKNEWISLTEIRHLFNQLSNKIKLTSVGKKIEKKITMALNDQLIPAKLFTAIQRNGDTIHLSDFKYKYILLDFNASWCIPCRQIIPKLKKLYEKYNDKLVILSISNQTDKKDWIKAIQEDKISWPCILENDENPILSPIGQSITKMYGIQTFPSLILINDDLKVVGWYGNFYQSKQDFLLELKNKLRYSFGY
ncbi:MULTISPECIES: TlpA disulfide reductase family protein [Hydrotalea]|jgi:thiol-disulfide isomerase/thioredoxin/gluconate kinase|uniref:Thiol-disulfide isomerase/thioredoxin n=1 Tax=Hydrotalea sandarakina TaxID=1004304 RepID=A0A2W7RLX0_9BACT|nr:MULTISPECIES: TlpA disulfide reductase family protein [Hydrotalea]PZX59490.1 thiol-disulfide isomerase/thioredoxin [Hydrotalea sandarakina]RWZ85479.1 MAG: AhpC/TSA family protein [Hydrotalea sp. AMD]